MDPADSSNSIILKGLLFMLYQLLKNSKQKSFSNSTEVYSDSCCSKTINELINLTRINKIKSLKENPARPQKAGVCWRGCYITPSPWENGSRLYDLAVVLPVPNTP
ncbi:hypothetical protein BpHYR1_001163 [Brachionus plicatilis]|uniref:Uncharacterized protein n=1 Tax=Brachionus plicatilis TaxID=10195 RepID=A0A3M7RL20_BRAPC|nr:hypothetical protein BpHYR1_001163 [Brachionus plicatilis]